ncbi:MAG: DNA mismatch repair protein MutS [Myxococcota bacterium]|jgi:DNA mismatch repair protein MutS
MMRQFFAAKKKHPNALLFFRMGDFYEMFFDDAKVAAKELGLSLTARDKAKQVPMAGVPVRSMEGYLTRLVRAGHTVAICEQMQDPRDAKGIVDRDVVRVVSPGTLVDESSLIGSEPLFVLAVDVGEQLGLAWADLSTGAFRCSQCTIESFIEEVARIQPAEVLLPEFNSDEQAQFELTQSLQELLAQHDIPVSWRMPWNFDAKNGRRDLCKQLKVSTLEAYGIEESPQIIAACGGLLDFLHDTQKSTVEQLRELSLHRAHQHLLLDQATRRTLEIVKNQQDGSRQGTLLATIDRSGTAMGARLLREWVLEPLIDKDLIEARHDAVDEFVIQANARKAVAATLTGMADLERLAAKLASGRSGPRDINALAAALELVPALLNELSELSAPQLCELREDLNPHLSLVTKIRGALSDAPPLLIKDGGLIRDGFSAAVDELRELAQGGKDYLAAMQQRESERLGVPVKLGFNRVFGYYIELTSSVVSKAPEDYIRKQTLKNAERYITPELKEYEHKVLGAEEKLKDVEYKLFEELREEVLGHANSVASCASAIAKLDVLQSLASIAVEKRFVRPQFIEAAAESCGILNIKEGRHPVVEDALLGQVFVPNDTSLGDDYKKRLAIITGPNMSGKSTYLRQTAIVVLLAQIGSFVPAESVEMTLVDRIFTRLGSGDDISRGQSTFMVEMVETANILRNATNRSLLLLDEVGRGTSTFDGLAIAWAVCEFVHDKLHARCLFATHYHQLTDLADKLSAGVNLNVAVREWGEEIIFLHRIEEGGTDRSYGIHVAQLAGLPHKVLQRSQEILQRLEEDEEGLSRKILRGQSRNVPAIEQVAIVQPSLFDLIKNNDDDGELLSELKGLNLDELPPIEAWQILDRVLRTIKK